MRMLSLALVVASALPLAALAQTATPTPPASADTEAKADDQKLICVDQDPGSGSRLQPKRVCHTRQEWTKLGGVPR